MRGRVIIVVALAALIVVSAIAPASAAAPPEKGTFTAGTIEFETNPGEQVLTDNVMHIRNSHGTYKVVGTPWGDGSAEETVTRAEIDVTTGLGSSTSKIVEVYPNGIVEGTVQADIEGLQFWTYLGPTFSFTLNGRTVTVVNGATYLGLYLDVTAVKHGVSGELEGIQIREESQTIRILDGDLAGMALGYTADTYW